MISVCVHFRKAKLEQVYSRNEQEDCLLKLLAEMNPSLLSLPLESLPGLGRSSGFRNFILIVLKYEKAN